MRKELVAAVVMAGITLFAAAAQAVPLVTYSWTTTSQGFGLNLGQPSTATFQVPLSDVQTGFINQFDVTNIQLAYPGLSFVGTTTSSTGSDFGTFVDPTTGALIFHDANQGFSVFAYNNDLFTYDTFLSILVGNPVGGVVKDAFNALNHNQPAAGFPTAGFWTATLPAVTPPATTPVPAALPLFASGLLGFGFIARRRKQVRR